MYYVFVVEYAWYTYLISDFYIFAVYLHICLPFYKRVELKDRERFPESKPAKEKPFRMYNDNAVITVKLTNLEDGWELDKTNDTQV